MIITIQPTWNIYFVIDTEKDFIMLYYNHVPIKYKVDEFIKLLKSI